MSVELMEKYIRYRSKDPKKLEKQLLNANPEFLQLLSQKKALYIFNKAVNEIELYKKFLRKNQVVVQSIKTIADFRKKIPIMDKENYIKEAKDIRELCFNKDISKINILFESSGYTGKPSIWPKTKEEEEQEKKYVTVGLDIIYKTYDKRTLFINTFALGSWVTGVELARISDGHCTLINPGPNEGEVYEIIKNFSKDFDQFIIAGYPPFIKNLIDKGGSIINWKEHTIHFLLGAEGMPEELRDYIFEQVGEKAIVMSGYGASDIGITGINETKETVLIRRLARDNPQFNKEIFNGHHRSLPMLFQYDPLSYFIEVNEKNELVFTTININIAMPLIRYNLKDTGGVISYDKMTDVLKRHKIDIKFEFPFPFMYLIGRSDGAINFFGSLVYPNFINGVIYKNKKLRSKTTNNFKLSVKYDKEHKPILSIDIQLKKGVKKSKMLSRSFERLIESEMFDKIEDLLPKKKLLSKMYKQSIIKVRLYSFDKYPYISGIKIKYK
ncbi:phenylacetate--CoA ligase family protein [Candidatus Woesearchaeota archaeon]|nr:phenylacetate--CoA ligase family protein [Candidatus Woesearchaeota archaeon]